MKNTALALLFALLTLPSAAQVHIIGSGADTLCVYVVYIDSVRIFAGYPDYDLRVAVAPGWLIRSRTEERFLDQAGVEFPQHRVLLYRRRYPEPPNPFRK